MDIHPPHEPVHTWKEFATHLSIMTVGLFIALMLESLVEYAHHRHILHQARENIRVELTADHAQAQKNLGYLKVNIDRIKGNIDTLQSIRKRTMKHGSLTNSMEFDSLHESAWRTARDTGALAYMPYAEVQRYSDIYSAVEDVNHHASVTADHEFSALAPTMEGYDMSSIPLDEVTVMLRADGQTEIDLVTEEQFVEGLDDQILKALKQ